MDSDILLGQRAGIKTILVRTGRGKDFENSVHSDFVIDNINAIKEVFYG